MNKKVGLVWLFSLFFAYQGVYAQSKDQVIEMDRLLNELIVKRNVEKANPLYAEDFILSTSSGKRKTKTDILKDISNPDIQWEINETTEVQVFQLDNTVILIGTLRQKGLFKNQPFDNKMRVTDTWVWTKGKWQLVAGHASLLPQN